MTMDQNSAPPQIAFEPDFQVHLQTGKGAARLGIDKVLQELNPLQLDEEELSTVELVLAEALNNIAEHAYQNTELTGPIDISCLRLANGLHFLICDKGCPMPDETVPAKDRPEVEVDTMDLPEGGFGWFLIQDLAKDVVYQRIDDENQLRLRIAVAYERSPH